MMAITVQEVQQATEELLTGLNSLLPQLSSSAPPLEIADLEGIVSSSAITLFVATDGDVVVGSLSLAIFPIPTGLRAWIEDVVVDGAARGVGVGGALMNAAIDEARRRGARSLDLTSRPSREPANGLYQRLGFEKRETNVYRFFIENELGLDAEN
jgi:ribosomal protein S18 acetylase RimI-like enzyme